MTMNRRWRYALVVAFLLGVGLVVPLVLSACGSGIPVKQEVLFTNHKTILPTDFPRHDYVLEQLELKGHDDTALRAWWMTTPGATGTVIYFGGQGFHMVQSRAWVDAVLPHASSNILMVDYRGYGLSEGEPGVTDLQKDALAIFDAIAAREDVDPARVVVHGQSMGSFVALHVARRRAVSGVVLETPVTNADDWARTILPWYLRAFLRFDFDDEIAGVDNLEQISGLDVPVLLIAGEKDGVAPAALAEKLRDAATKAPSRELVVVPGGDHNDLPEHEAFRDAYFPFVDSLLGR